MKSTDMSNLQITVSEFRTAKKRIDKFVLDSNEKTNQDEIRAFQSEMQFYHSQGKIMHDMGIITREEFGSFNGSLSNVRGIIYFQNKGFIKSDPTHWVESGIKKKIIQDQPNIVNVNVYRTSCSGSKVCREILISSGKMTKAKADIIRQTPRHRIEIITENQITTVDHRRIIKEINQLNRESKQKQKEIEIFSQPFTTIEKKLASGIIPDLKRKEIQKPKTDIVKPLMLGLGILLLGISR